MEQRGVDPPARNRASRYLKRTAPVDLTLGEFKELVDQALESLPARFGEMVHNVIVSIEDEPSAEDIEALDPDDDPRSELLGIYRGVALTERTHDAPIMPDEIAIFRGPILRVARTRREAVQEIQDTVVHELGHYFGLSDEEMHR